MRDNQNAGLAAAKKRIEIEKKLHDAGMEKLEKELKGISFAEWTEVDGVKVLRIKDSQFVAVPTSRRKTSRKFDIINLDTREFVCQVSKKDVHNWLIRSK